MKARPMTILHWIEAITTLPIVVIVISFFRQLRFRAVEKGIVIGT
jgi:hypothetical protein